MFNSNVQPKRLVEDEPVGWYCHNCNKEIPKWYRKCPQCKEPRNN